MYQQSVDLSIFATVDVFSYCHRLLNSKRKLILYAKMSIFYFIPLIFVISASQQIISEYNEIEYLQYQHFINLKSYYNNVLDNEVEEGPLKDEVDRKIDAFFEVMRKRDPNTKEYVFKRDRKKRDINSLFEIKNELGK